jgi:hypothetical protein
MCLQTAALRTINPQPAGISAGVQRPSGTAKITAPAKARYFSHFPDVVSDRRSERLILLHIRPDHAVVASQILSQVTGKMCFQSAHSNSICVRVRDHPSSKPRLLDFERRRCQALLPHGVELTLTRAFEALGGEFDGCGELFGVHAASLPNKEPWR